MPAKFKSIIIAGAAKMPKDFTAIIIAGTI